MDPITIGTTVASLVATFTKGAQTCNTLLSKYEQAPQMLASIHTECTTIKLALSHVYWLVNSNTELLSSQLDAQGPLAETFDVALTGCAVTFSLLDIELQKLCQQSKGSDTYKAKNKIKFVWNEDLARSLLDDMRGLQGAVTLLLTALQTSSLAALNLAIAEQRPVIDRVRQSTTSICQGLGRTSRVSHGNNDTYSIFNSTIGDEEFAFDNEVINTQVYRRVLNKASKAQVLQNADPGQEPELFDEPLIDLSGEPKGNSVPTLDDPRLGSRWFGSFDGALPMHLPDSDFADLANERAQGPISLHGALPAELSDGSIFMHAANIRTQDPALLDSAPPAEVPGDSAFLNSANEGAQYPTPLGGTSSPIRPGTVPPLDRPSLEPYSAEPSVVKELKSRSAELPVREDIPYAPDKAVDMELVACEQEENREQHIKEDDLGGVGSGLKTDREIWLTEKLARGRRSQKAHLAVYQMPKVGRPNEQPPHLSNMRTTVQPSMVHEEPPPAPQAQVVGSSNLSKTAIITDNARPWVLEDAAPEPRYETTPSSPLIKPIRPLQFYSHAPFSFESLRAAMTPLDRSISRTRSDASGYESVRDLHTNNLPRRTPSLQMEYRLSTLSGVATSESSQSRSQVEPPDLIFAKQPDRYTDKGVGNSAFTHDRIIPWQEDNGKPFPPTIDMQSVPRSNLERSGYPNHDFILSALTWLVDPYSYTINDTIVSKSISETTILLLGSMSGKTSACATYAAQNPELMSYAAVTVSVFDYRIRVPMIMNRFGVTQESIVTLRDTGAELSAHEIDKFSRNADVVLLCYPIDEGSFDNVSEYWFPQIREHCPQVPVILAGMRTDEREKAYRSGNYHSASHKDGLTCAKTNRTAAYVECSSTNVRSINQMFETAIRLALVSKLKVQQVQSPRLKHKLSRWWQGHREKLSI